MTNEVSPHTPTTSGWKVFRCVQELASRHSKRLQLFPTERIVTWRISSADTTPPMKEAPGNDGHSRDKMLLNQILYVQYVHRQQGLSCYILYTVYCSSRFYATQIYCKRVHTQNTRSLTGV